ncbi:sensor histidine kinase [Gracilibacillus alcaliphilus]|uniref:sensor histidine kinase n=1 Tax=Gracilibacillus alcaliphilus TaxID=1401441 RepID=UPI0019560759|nr:HAMP domain-containing sensor histidine kinase [Gracilibacillus alcaliphilus]MBM7675726.1 signal transduction histidine kinase [Gracilibacillus alcaliphilus]
MRNDKVSILLVLQLLMITGILMIDINEPMPAIISWCLFLGVCLVTVILLSTRIRYFAQLKRMDTELKRAVYENANTRLLANHDKALDELTFSINDLLEQLEKIQIQSIKSQTARKRILSSISHDIRTPLTSIIGYIDALQDDISISEQERNEYIATVSKKANSLKQLLDDLFDMAKLDADEFTLKEERLDFAEVARESVISFLPELKKEGIELKVHIPEDTCYIMADHQSLIRIIGNVIKNALHYGKDGGILGVELIETDNNYQMLIWDRGPGISDEDMENIFERMYRGEDSRNRSYGGSGLGLSIAKELVERNHGQIWVESMPWKKTTFGFLIPKHTGKSQLRNN